MPVKLWPRENVDKAFRAESPVDVLMVSVPVTIRGQGVRMLEPFFTRIPAKYWIDWRVAD